jgi:hypothetical protein
MTTVESPPIAERAPESKLDAARRRLRDWRPITYPLGVYVVSRVYFLATVLMALRDPESPHTFLDFQSRWDSGFYIRIAQGGYASTLLRRNGVLVGTEHAFLPGYPLLVRAVGNIVPGDTVLVAIIVSMAAGAVAAVLMWRLAWRLADSDVADRTLLLFCFFPGTLAFNWPYSEGLMIALCIGAILLLLDDRWLLASLLTACATLTRSNALPVAVACAWVAWGARPGPLVKRLARAGVALAIAASGFVGFVIWVGQHVHEPMAWFTLEHKAWGEGFAWKRFPTTLRDAIFKAPTFARDITILFFAIAVVLALVTIFSNQAGWLKLISLGALYFAVTANIAQVSPRLQLAAIPAFVALGTRLRGTGLVLWVAGSALLSALLVFAYGSIGPPWYMFAP